MLRLVDTVVLQEVESLPTGNLGQVFGVDDSGVVYLPDESRNQILVYDRQGILQRTIGRQGSGPGELRGIGSTFVFDSLLIQNQATRILSVFDRRSGRFLSSRRYNGYARFAGILGDQLWVGVFDASARQGVAVTPLADLLTPTEPQRSVAQGAALIPFPSEYSVYPGLATANFVAVVPTAVGGLAGYASGTDALYEWNIAARRLDTVALPIVLRRGNRLEGLLKLRGVEPVPPDEQLASTSVLYGLYALAGGDVLVWNEDNSAERRGRDGLGNFKGRAFLSVVSADRTRACVDTELPFPGTSWPRIGVSKDTIYALDQRLTGASGVLVVTVVRRYAIDLASCKWIRTQSN